MSLILQPELVDWYKDHPEDDPGGLGGQPNMNTNTTTSEPGSQQGSENGSKKAKVEE
jgi:hypothetical protein